MSPPAPAPSSLLSAPAGLWDRSLLWEELGAFWEEFGCKSFRMRLLPEIALFESQAGRFMCLYLWIVVLCVFDWESCMVCLLMVVAYVCFCANRTDAKRTTTQHSGGFVSLVRWLTGLEAKTISEYNVFVCIPTYLCLPSRTQSTECPIVIYIYISIY